MRTPMFDNRENLIGIVLLGLCLVVVGALVYQIGSGDRFTYNGPGWLPPLLSILFFGAMAYSFYVAFIRDRSNRNQWPSPTAGRPSLWDRIRGKNKQ